MTTHQCDICHKEISDGAVIYVRIGWFSNGKELCEICAKPVVNFMKKNGFIKDRLADKS
ncbi:MAG: hypothetical protein Q8P11_00925 [bacterium]|nr:hypothetical protein [bacterium]